MVSQSGFFQRHRDFLLSWKTIVTLTNGLLLLIGLIVSLTVGPKVGQWIYLTAALAGGVPIVIRALKAVIIERDITVDLMVAVAMVAAVAVGEYVAAALVVFMLSIGETLEDFTVSRADNALDELASLIPATVTIRRDGLDVTVPVAEVVVGDTVLVRTAERIGVDGVVISGHGCVNQSAVTGESLAVDKRENDTVYAGTLNEIGALIIKASSVGRDTTVGKIVKLVKEAQESQAPVQRLANRYATILVPVTFLIAIVVGIVTQDVLRSVTVLVVVCPCALVLATPTAVVAAIGNSARRGILVKSGRSIEQIGKVDVVAFDKTGTLTRGKPVVREFSSLNEMPTERIIWLAATAERLSEHSIGHSIVAAAQEKSIALGEPTDFTVLPGFGVKARIDNQSVIIGNQRLFREQGIGLSSEHEASVREYEKTGCTTILVAVDGKPEGVITLADEPRPEAKEAISRLNKLGVEQIIMITGDSHETAQMIASDLGIEHFHAEVLPEEKLKIIRELQGQGKKVAFVGDGVNDAPAIAAADMGIAMGISGTDTAMETAEICLMQDDLRRIPYVIGLSRKSLRVIRMNVIFSMSVNVLSLFLGGFGIIGPVIGALMHETSALPVLANSARLVNHRDQSPTKGEAN